MPQADWNRLFFGTIKRGFDENGHPVVLGKIMVNNGFVCAIAANQDVLVRKLDEMTPISYYIV